MKKWINRILGCICLLFAAVLGVTLTSCEHFTNFEKRHFVDSTKVAEMITQKVTPAFSDLERITVYKQQRQVEYKTNSTFVAMSDQTLKSVVNVLLSRQTTVTVEQVVNEYLNNREIYDNLPKPEPPKEIQVQQYNTAPTVPDTTKKQEGV